MSGKFILVALLAILTLSSLAKSSTPAGFIDDFDEALKQAKAENKLILVDFSGSDWCFWCQRLDEEVFAQAQFVEEASKRYVLVMIDQPRDKSRLSLAARDRNKALARRFKVTSYPTVLILNSDGKIVGETGFVGGGAKNYLKHLEEKEALIPYVLEYVKPLDKRIGELYGRMNKGIQRARAECSNESEAKIAEMKALLGFAAELEKIAAEEASREVPEIIVKERNERIALAKDSARQMREFAEKHLK